jgi:hypothetical protein
MPQSYYLHKYPGSATRVTMLRQKYNLPVEVEEIIQFLVETPRRMSKIVKSIAAPERVRVFREKVARLLEYDRVVGPFTAHMDMRTPGNLGWMMSTFPEYVNRMLKRNAYDSKRLTHRARQYAVQTKQNCIRNAASRASTSYQLPNVDPIAASEVEYLAR